jgi:hypothetical protein
MTMVDFREIQPSKGGEVGQDEWAIFAREFFDAMGVKAEEGPDRGPDEGRDLILVERRIGMLGTGEHRWLVSCKHYAHSNKSVLDSKEWDIQGRLRKFNANGFIAFYSTVPSSGLSKTLEHAKKEGFGVEVYDCGRIERALLENPMLKRVFERFFPKSYAKYTREHISPRVVGESPLKIRCNVCNKDLLSERAGIFAFGNRVTKGRKVETVDVYWACKGECDRLLESSLHKRGLVTGWEDIDDLSIPLVYMHWTITWMNSLRKGEHKFTDEAYEKFSEFTFALAQLVVRETTEEERERIESLRDIPFYLGGLDQWGTELKYIQT